MNRTVVVTGANGFIGSSLSVALERAGFNVRRVTRRSIEIPTFTVGSIGADTKWFGVLEGADTVVHTAARVHIPSNQVQESEQKFHEVNVLGTRNLAVQAAQCNVRRFVLISSIKVNGESTDGRGPFNVQDPPAPQDQYGLSKQRAEEVLQTVADRTGMESIIVRPPLVYGKNVRANFRRLMLLVRRGMPLPFGSVDNRRSLIFLGNLVDLLIRCVATDRAPRDALLVSDGEDLSTRELIQRLACVMGKPARLFPVPVTALRALARLTGKSGEVDRLVGSLQIDPSVTSRLLEWSPPYTVDEGLRLTVELVG